jgi:nucleoside-diphosphate-sugar epimerase
MVVSILGCGWYGMALAGELVKQGITIKGSTTSEQKLAKLADIGIQPYLVQISADSESFDSQFFECDVLFISIPPRFRKGETAGYISKLQRIIQAIQQYQISKVIYISSTAVYGDHNSVADELTVPIPDTESGLVLLEAEELLQQQTSFKTTILRFGGLVGPGRHPGRFFSGKKDIPNGRAPVNLIHLYDCIGISIAILKQNAFGFVFNACSPDHPAKADFYCRAAFQAGLPVPEFLDELDRWKMVDSVNLSAILHYEFKVDSWVNCSF